MSDNIFSQSTEPTAPAATTPASNPSFNLPSDHPAAEFIGPGKKYATVEDALKSIPHAQNHIKTLEQEAKDIREALEGQMTVKQLLEEARNTALTNQPPAPTEPKFDPADLTQIVNQTIEQREAQNRAKANQQNVASTFKTKYGDQAQAVYEALAKENGLSLSSLNVLAATSPQAVLKLAGLSSHQPTPPVMSSSVNSEALHVNTPPAEKSAYVGSYPSTKKLVEAWKIAGEKVRNRQT